MNNERNLKSAKKVMLIYLDFVFESVYFVVKTGLGAHTERRYPTAEKNLSLTSLRPKGRQKPQIAYFYFGLLAMRYNLWPKWQKRLSEVQFLLQNRHVL